VGTTLDALDGTTTTTGSIRFAWVALIEGYEKLLTSHGSTAAVLAAYAGTDHTGVTRGLSVDLQLEQTLHPDEPFGSMGTCQLWMARDGADDSFGIATHRRGGAGTYLTQTLNRTDTTAHVKSTAFAPSSGVIHIGTEAMSYASKTSTTFEGLVRGLYSPAGAAGGTRFARDHHVTEDDHNIKLQPKVTLHPRSWKGRFVSVYMHRVVDGVLDVKAEAECVYAGTVGEIRDDRQTKATTVEVRSLTDWVGNRVVGDNLWQGTASSGLVMTVGMRFFLREKSSTGGTPNADNTSDGLEVVASGASGTNELNAGIYSLGEICDALTAWIAGERAAMRLEGSYSFASPLETSSGMRTRIDYSLAGDDGFFALLLPDLVATFLGFSTDITDEVTQPNHSSLKVTTMGVGLTYEDPHTEPMRVMVTLDGRLERQIDVDTTTNELEDQYTYLPGSIRPPTRALGGTDYSWGLFVVDDSTVILAAWDPSDPTVLVGVRPWLGAPASRPWWTITGASSASTINLQISLSAPTTRIRQIIAYEGNLESVLLGMTISTGTPGYNQAFIDSLPASLSLGVPLAWVGANFANELPGSGETLCVVVEKPTAFSTLLESDMQIRFGFLSWERGTLRYGSWRSPTLLEAIAELDHENTKAEASGVEGSHDATSNQTDEFTKTIVKVEFNRPFAKLDDEEYASYVMFADRVAADDEGGAVKVHTISMANTFDELEATGVGVDALLPLYLARMPLISRTAWLIERSISATAFWGLHKGAIVTVTDPNARNPTTGMRGLVNRPALVVRLSFAPGGELPGSDQPMDMGGRITLLITDTDPDKTGALYAPAANVDKSANPSGFSNGYNDSERTLRTLEHDYSDADEDVDAASFDDGDEVLIVERDPYDPDNPIVWQRTIESRSGRDLVLDVALSAPAWDPTREYVVLFADFGDVVSQQHAHTFQADDATGVIDGSTEPYDYGSANADPGADPNDAAEPELPCNRISSDGAGRCVYGDTQLIRLVDNFIDYRSAQRDALLLASEVSNLDVTGGDYKFVAMFPVLLTHEILSNAVVRYITCAPWAGSTDGTPTKMRIRLCRVRPDMTSLVNWSPSGPYAEAEWTGIANTTPTTLAEVTTLTVNVKAGSLAAHVIGLVRGHAWVTIELGYKCTTRGIAAWAEGARVTS
jgi:hypothetical protein